MNIKIKALLAVTTISLLSSPLALSRVSDLAVTYGPQDAIDNDFVTETGQLIEEILPDREISRLHANNHSFTPLVRSLLPPYYDLPSFDSVDDFVTTQNEMAIINPIPGEYVRIVEGKRHGFLRSTVALTVSMPGSGAPLHTHDVETSHTVVTEQRVRYQIRDEIFEVKGPYVINIPPLVPHAFVNLSKKPLSIVLSFPTDTWQVDFLDQPNIEEFFTVPVTKKDRRKYRLIRD